MKLNFCSLNCLSVLLERFYVEPKLNLLVNWSEWLAMEFPNSVESHLVLLSSKLSR